jgi:uncharacterized membrane protein HdeD (DUF308 family)
MTDPDTPGATAYEPAEKRSAAPENRFWLKTHGTFLVLLGFAAIVFPFATTVAARTFVGWLLVMAGVAHGLHGSRSRTRRSLAANLLIGILYVVVGGWLALFPFTGIVTVTLLLAAAFVVEGLVKLAIGVSLRPMEGWGWSAFSGLVAVLVGVLLLAQPPETAVWVLGLLVGVNFLMSGIALMMVATRSGRV